MKRILRNSKVFQTRRINDGPKLEVPTAGKSSGSEDLDEATKKWRFTNTIEDEKFKNVKDIQEITSKIEPKMKEIYKNPVTGEINGPRGPEPTRFGDWERSGRCFDF